jgi:hypothetical protein
VGNDGLNDSDYLGLMGTGPFDSIDKAGYYGSIMARNLTFKADNVREYCGLICCKMQQYMITNPHPGPDRQYDIEQNRVKIFRGGNPTCNPNKVACPEGWTKVGMYHSHPAGALSDVFSGELKPGVGDSVIVDGTGLPLYLGTPSGKVKRLDPEKDRKKAITYPGVDVPTPKEWNK